MIFNNTQVQDMLGILDRYQSVFVLQQLGLSYLTQAERDLLEESGIDLSLYINNKGILEHAFLFGVLSDALGDARAKQLNYKQFQRFLSSGAFIPLTEAQEFALEQVKNRSYNDIKGLGSRIKQGTSNVIVRSNQQQQIAVQKLIKQKTIQAVQLKMSATALAAELGEATKDWERDWLRIAYYLLHEAYNGGKAQNILKTYGTDAEVYFDVYPGACKHCKILYLTDPEDPDSEPIVYRLEDVIANGNNIGRKVDEYLPTISPVHPYCRCTINYRNPNMEWDWELRAFIKPKKYQPKNPKLQGVKLNIVVTKAEQDELEKAHNVGDVHPNGKWIWVQLPSGKFDWRVSKIPQHTFDMTAKNPEIEKCKTASECADYLIKEKVIGPRSDMRNCGLETAKKICNVTYNIHRRFNNTPISLTFRKINSNCLMQASDGRVIEINSSYFTNFNEKRAYDDNVTKYISRKQYAIDIIDQNINSLSRLNKTYNIANLMDKKKELEEDLKRFPSWTVSHPNSVTEDVMIHEFGHILNSQCTGGCSHRFLVPRSPIELSNAAKFNQERNDLFGKYKKQGYYISEYGLTKPAEFFAESFTAYMANDKNLPVDVKDFLDRYFSTNKAVI